MPHTISVDNFESQLKGLIKKYFDSKEQKLKLILHVGTPKTGTTSLQVYLNKKSRKLRSLGIIYPNTSHNPDAPKHQWFEKNLIRLHPQNFYDNFEMILQQVKENTHTILLSSEGIYNHWWDFDEESTILLKALNNCFDVKIWVWFRNPVEFAESFYKQCLRNPVVQNIPCYGKDLSFAEILKDPWFLKRLDYLSFVENCDALFGEEAISIFEYQQDTVRTVTKLFGLDTPHDNPTPRKNLSMNDLTTDFYRVINRLELSAKEKEAFIPAIQILNEKISAYNHRKTFNPIDLYSKETLTKLSKESMLAIGKRYIQI